MLKQVLVGAVLLSGAAWATDYGEDAKPHPDIPGMRGYKLESSEQSEFDAREFNTGRKDADGLWIMESKEGAFHKVTYREEEGTKVSPLQILRNYENAFKNVGGRLIATEIVNSNSANATFHIKKGNGSRWVNLFAADDGDWYELYILDEQKMQQEIEMSAMNMADNLARNGLVALYGTNFETGKADILPSSEPLLAEIVTLMKQQSGLKLSVEGHTDNVGNAKSNKALSQARAEAVKKWLVGKGIAAGRLSTNGHGAEMPIADNRIEDGRAKNRRVELVKK